MIASHGGKLIKAYDDCPEYTLEVCKFDSEGGLQIEETMKLMKIMEGDLYNDVQNCNQGLNVQVPSMIAK